MTRHFIPLPQSLLSRAQAFRAGGRHLPAHNGAGGDRGWVGMKKCLYYATVFLDYRFVTNQLHLKPNNETLNVEP